MSTATGDPLETLIRESGEDWLIDWYSPRGSALPSLHERLRRADEAARSRFGPDAPGLTPNALVLEHRQNPHKVRAFLQILGSAASPDILVMVWRILQGAEITAIQMAYRAGSMFTLHVSLSLPEGGNEEYETADIDDAVILRHLGTMKLGNQGLFDGLYALNLGNNS